MTKIDDLKKESLSYTQFGVEDSLWAARLLELISVWRMHKKRLLYKELNVLVAVLYLLVRMR